MRTLGIVIPTYERTFETLRAYVNVRSDERVSEILISDDASTEDSFLNLERLIEADGDRRVTLRRNPRNLGSWGNKREAVATARSDRVALIDCDNVIDASYLDALFAIPKWDRDTLCIPTWAAPHVSLDYRRYAGLVVTAGNVREHLEEPLFQRALNTGNYFFHRETYLSVLAEPDVDVLAADGIYALYCWLKSGREVLFAPGLHYAHEVRADGHWTRNAARTDAVTGAILAQMGAL